jgi:hypothetical protein
LTSWLSRASVALFVSGFFILAKPKIRAKPGKQ